MSFQGVEVQESVRLSVQQKHPFTVSLWVPKSPAIRRMNIP